LYHSIVQNQIKTVYEDEVREIENSIDSLPQVLFYFILFYFILFYFILFYFILFYFILFYFILFYLF